MNGSFFGRGEDERERALAEHAAIVARMEANERASAARARAEREAARAKQEPAWRKWTREHATSPGAAKEFGR